MVRYFRQLIKIDGLTLSKKLFDIGKNEKDIQKSIKILNKAFKIIKKGNKNFEINEHIKKIKSEIYYKKGLHIQNGALGLNDYNEGYRMFKKSLKYNSNNEAAVKEYCSCLYDRGKYTMY
jgi:hypothetical protein